MAVSSVTSKATSALKSITEAANTKPSKPIALTADVFMALEKKLVALAKKDAPRASGLVDLMTELHKQGLLKLSGNTGPLPYSSENMWKEGMNSIKKVLNSNAATFDDKPIDSLAK